MYSFECDLCVHKCVHLQNTDVHSLGGLTVKKMAVELEVYFSCLAIDFILFLFPCLIFTSPFCGHLEAASLLFFS